MLKDLTIKRISILSIILFLCLLFMFFPNDDVVNKKEEVIYTTNDELYEIYMVNKYDYVAIAHVSLAGDEVIDKARELIEYLIIDGKKENSIPNGFRSIIPSGTIINKLDFNDGILTIDFSSEFNNIEALNEKKMYESIIYSLTTIKEVKGIIITVNDELVRELKTHEILPDILTRDFGINKKYDINDVNNINSTTIYYVFNDTYIPITRVNNNTNEKIEIIVDDLTNIIEEDYLESYLNINTELLNYEINDDVMYLNFNEYLYDNLENKVVLEEVLNTINYSVYDNYGISEVVFMVNNEIVSK